MAYCTLGRRIGGTEPADWCWEEVIVQSAHCVYVCVSVLKSVVLQGDERENKGTVGG